jgi:hypothetical protein
MAEIEKLSTPTGGGHQYLRRGQTPPQSFGDDGVLEQFSNYSKYASHRDKGTRTNMAKGKAFDVGSIASLGSQQSPTRHPAGGQPQNAPDCPCKQGQTHREKCHDTECCFVYSHHGDAGWYQVPCSALP